MDLVQQSPVRRGQFVAVGAVCLLLTAAAVATGWFIHEALEERSVATAATNLQLAAQTVASAEGQTWEGSEAPRPDLVAAIAELERDHEVALHPLGLDDRRKAERLLAEIAECGTRLLASGSDSGHEGQGHAELQILLSTSSSKAVAEAATAEKRALVGLLVAAVAAAAVAWFLIRSRRSELRLRRDLFRQANTDLLTGLPNRRALDLVMNHAKAQMKAKRCITGLIFLDLDGFKDINDTLGHHVGDEVLVQVADRLRSAQRAGDVLLRLGGDEFAVVLPALQHRRAAEQTAYRYLQALEEPFVIGSKPEHLRTSVGVTSTDDPARIQSSTVEADRAMYEAKRNGGNAVAVFDPCMETHSNETSRITRALRAAVYDDEFTIVYQPIVTVDRSTIVGYEALLRWTSPTLGVVNPNTFIPVAERSGEICQIGRWVFDNVCRQLRAWDQGDNGEVSISFNVSPHQLDDDHFVEHIFTTLDGFDLSRRRFIIEVTESAVLDHTGAAVARLAQLRDAGFRVSIDDFGSGYSNLGQLLQVPFDIIKIDRSLLMTLSGMRENAGGDPSAPCAIMEAIVSIASVFNAPVICEGVETEQQRRSVEASGINLIQGYLTGRPTPPAELDLQSESPVLAAARPR